MNQLSYRSSPLYFSEETKHQIIQDYLKSGLSKLAIWHKYTGRTEEHGTILKWMRQYGYSDDNRRKSSNIVLQKPSVMSKEHHSTSSDFEKRQLEKRISELEHRLKEAELKVIAYSTLVDVAEEMFKLPIRKKLNTKPLK